LSFCPGLRHCFGFQLAIVLTQSFRTASDRIVIMHATSLFLVAFAVVLLMAPAAYHRSSTRGRIRRHAPGGERAGNRGNRSTGAWTCGRCLCRGSQIIMGSRPPAHCRSLALVLLIGLWHVYPLVAVSIQKPGSQSRGVGHPHGISRVLKVAFKAKTKGGPNSERR